MYKNYSISSAANRYSSKLAFLYVGIFCIKHISDANRLTLEHVKSEFIKRAHFPLVKKL